MLQDILRLLTAPLTQLLPTRGTRPAVLPLPRPATSFDDEMRALIAQKSAIGATGHDDLSMMIQARDEQSGTALSGVRADRPHRWNPLTRWFTMRIVQCG